jgi:hypothetical protein
LQGHGDIDQSSGHPRFLENFLVACLIERGFGKRHIGLTPALVTTRSPH